MGLRDLDHPVELRHGARGRLFEEDVLAVLQGAEGKREVQIVGHHQVDQIHCRGDEDPFHVRGDGADLRELRLQRFQRLPAAAGEGDRLHVGRLLEGSQMVPPKAGSADECNVHP